MLTCLCRENAEIRIRSAVTRDGEIVGREAVVLMDCGAYGGEQIFLTTMTAHTLGGNYRLGAVRLVSRAVYTNTAPNGAFRACNGVYNTFALERHTDEICAAHRHGSAGVPPPQRVWATAISAPPGRCSRATCSGRCSTDGGELRSTRPVRSARSRATGSTGAPPRSAHGSSSSAPRRRPSTSTPMAARRW